jgi:hypothetical protein
MRGFRPWANTRKRGEPPGQARQRARSGGHFLVVLEVLGQDQVARERVAERAELVHDA